MPTTKVAAAYGQDEVVKLLIMKGAALEKSNDKKWTPLMQAARQGHSKVVSTLLQNHAYVNARTRQVWPIRPHKTINIEANGGNHFLVTYSLSYRNQMSKDFLFHDKFPLHIIGQEPMPCYWPVGKEIFWPARCWQVQASTPPANRAATPVTRPVTSPPWWWLLSAVTSTSWSTSSSVAKMSIRDHHPWGYLVSSWLPWEDMRSWWLW